MISKIQSKHSPMIQSSDARHKRSPVIETLPKVQKRDLKDSPYTLVAAMDLGTTYSGYAFSTKCDYKKSPLNVNTTVWKAGSSELATMKTSTCVLFKPDESFDTFGFEAEDKYARLMDEGKHHEWFFFRRFKMSLYDQKDISRSMKLYAQNRKPMLAMKVFTAAIQYMKDHLLETCKEKKVEVFMADVRWVLTMPAIWSDRSKQFMRECAQQAGIPGYQLVMSLEAEAAALCCKYLPIKDLDVGQKGDNIAVFSPGTRYMVVDVGGGTVDITVHEVQEGLKLKEVYMANGGDWGGTMVDKEFEAVLAEILHEDVFEAFKQKHEADYLELQRIFESKKRSISSAASEETKITFTLPVSLLETFHDMNPDMSFEENAMSNKKYANNITWKVDKLRMKHFLAKGMFAGSIQKIKSHLAELQEQQEVSEIKSIILVGGFAECALLQDEISSTFPGKRLIIPHDSGLAVLKGAVINGHELDAITERISRYTYGIDTCYPWDPSKHPFEYMFLSETGFYCRNVFSIHVKIGERINVGEGCETKSYNVMTADQTKVHFNIYVSLDKTPMYVTDEGCKCVGSLVVQMPDTRKGLNRGVDVELKFGGAEIEVKAWDRDTKEHKYAYFDFLQ
ncbi:heat shock 70 kDa protein 12A-like [Ylistrum balloti]|uniref:heat shock 70 kDa protein 12A-like n=1 Tax=Ylistrum balloti TaxID=509963 RepID=UPI002905A1DC|nr:heat shock 70 kDa protein 12A-like [Ylistrum balloti]